MSICSPTAATALDELVQPQAENAMHLRDAIENHPPPSTASAPS
jgi:hypothetical protein